MLAWPLPEHWTGTTRTRERVVNVTRQRVKEFVIDPATSDADYRVEASPGMVVLETDYGAPSKDQSALGFERKTFRVAEDGSWREIVNGVEQPPEGPLSWLRRHWLALTLACLLVRPRWTKGERFTIAHEEADSGPATYMHVRDGEPPTVSHRMPLGPVATSVVCPAEALLAVLAGGSSDDVTIRGEERPLALLQDWLKRAQSG